MTPKIEMQGMECTGTIILHKGSEDFPRRKEVTQVESISPKLFTPSLEREIRKVDYPV